MKRLLSYSEVSTALDCEARHAFRYTGALTDGTALDPKATAPILSEGKAWGRGIAAFHETGDRSAARAAIDASLEEDADRQREFGLYDQEQHEAMADRLHALLNHYEATVEPMLIDRLEHELEVPIPAQHGKRKSNRYRLLVRIDGIHTDANGRAWLVEYKLRKQLMPVQLIALSRQIRWYAWAAREAVGIDPVGVIVDERLNEVPGAPKFNQDGRPSKVQTCTLDAYLAACRESKHQPHDDVAEKLRVKRWHQREPIIFRPGEMEEAGRELVSAAKLIRDLDSGERYPLRNPKRPNCQGCPYRDICGAPYDTDLVDALYERVEPKRDREEVAA